MNQEKLKSTAKKLGVFFKVLQRVAQITGIFLIIMLAIITLLNHFLPDSAIGEDFYEIDFGTITVSLAPEFAPSNDDVLVHFRIQLAFAAVVLCLIYFICRTIRKILSPMEEGDPFNPSVSKYFRTLSFFFLGFGIINNISNFAETLSALHFLGQTNSLPVPSPKRGTTNFFV